MNKKLNGGSVTHDDVVSVGECIHMYYLFAEPFVNLDMRNYEDVKRDPSWPQMLLSVIKKSNALLGRNKISVSRSITDSKPVLGKKTLMTTHLPSIAFYFSHMSIFTRNLITYDGNRTVMSLLTYLIVSWLSPTKRHYLNDNRIRAIYLKGKVQSKNGDCHPHGFLSSSRVSKMHPKSSDVGKSVGFGRTENSTNGSRAAFERLERQSRKEKPSSSMIQTSDPSLGDEDFTAVGSSTFDVKFDCHIATHPYVGIKLEGSKGKYKQVLEYSGRSEETDLIRVDDILLSVDGNDVKEMTMTGLVAFMKRRTEAKILFCREAKAKESKTSFRRGYVRMTFRRMPSQNIKGSKKIPRLDLKDDENRSEPDTPPGPVRPKEAKRKRTETSKGSLKTNAPLKTKDELVKKKRQKKEVIVEDETIDEVDEAADEQIKFDKDVIFLKRMSVGSRIFLDHHPAEVLEIDMDTTCLLVKWESGTKGWINVDRERISLQEDLLSSSRRR
jgi:hypothetical protein